jgi:predicted component of type VI protein secretion system
VLNVQLSASEEAILRDVLEVVLSDLGMEIAGTDSQDFRDRLKERREVVRKVIVGLGSAPGS